MRLLLLPLLLLACPLVLMAQAGTLKGKVTNRQTAEALPGATVQLKGSSAMVITDNEGYYTLSPVPAGSITLLVSYSGYEKAALPVSVGEGTTTVDVALTLLHQTGNEVVVSASRRPQKITSAPAAISVIDTKDLEQFAGSNSGELMAYVQGVEFVRAGVDQTLFNARGFNNAFNSKVLQIIDGRNSMNTGSGGLALGNGATVVKEDIERIEVVLGPQSALYGPNAHNMLINTITKDPRKYPGTVVALGGGSREQMSGRFRHAAVLNRQWAYKLSGEYVTGKDYEFYDSVRAGGGVYGPAVIIPERIRDFDFRRIRGEGHVYYSVTPRTDIIVSGGASTNDYIQVTASTRNQMRDINYRFLQARLVHPNYFVTVYNAWGGLGTSYTIGSYTRDYWNRTHSTITDKTDPRFPTMGRLSPDEAEAAALKTRFNEQNQRFNAEAQYNDSFSKAGLFVVAGLSYQEDKPNSFGTTLIDKDRRIYVTQYGMVLQLEKALPFSLRFISAARYDNHNQFGDFISPRLALVKAIKEGSFRLTWGRAYSMPSILFRSANINGIFFGNGEGITYIPNGSKAGDPSSVRVTTPLEPEQVSTWEVGYKGRLREQLYVDINYYNGISKNFLSPSRSVGGKALKVGGVPVTPISPGQVDNNGILRNALFTTIFNYGEVQVYGLDAGVYYTFNRVVSGALKYSWFGSDIRENDPKNDLNKDSVVSEEERSLNAPWHRGTVQLRLQNLLRQKAFLHLSGRYVEQYNFYSGNQAGTASGKGKWGAAPKNFDWGPLGGFVTMDISAGYTLNQWVSVGMNITNAFDTEQREFVASHPIGRLIMLELKVRVPDDK